MAGFAGVSRGRWRHVAGAGALGRRIEGRANTALAKPQPSWVARELLLNSVLLPRTALQLRMPWSRLMSLANIPSSGFVWRGPVPKDQVTPSASPSGWHDPQLLQPLFDCLPRNFSGMMSRMGVSEMLLSGMPRAVKKASLPTNWACSTVPGVGGSPRGCPG